MRRLLVLCTVLGCYAPQLLAAAPTSKQAQFLSTVYTIDRKYRSMEGPSSVQKVYLGDRENPELLWIVAIRTEMVAEDGVTAQLPELMCHVNVDLDSPRHQAMFDLRRPVASRLMTLSQGMLSAKLPPGFGFPIASNEPLLLFTQVLNHNIEHPDNLKVRHRVTIDYVRDRDLSEPMKPLFNVGASGMVQLDNNPLALSTMMPTSADAGATHDSEHPASCLIGSRAPNGTAASADYVDPKGRHMTGHWVVPPGRQVNSSDITWFMNLPFNSTLHYAAVHLHPFAESLSIKDVTTGQMVLQSNAVNPPEGVGLTHVDTFTSVPGVSLLKDHQYELVSVYNNTTPNNADSMASVFLGLDDPEFVKPTSAALAKRSAVLFEGDIIVMRTSVGDLPALLQRTAAPNTIVQFSRLLVDGVFENTSAINSGSDLSVAIPMTDRVRRLFQGVGGDRGTPIERGTVMYCAPPEPALRIVLKPGPAYSARCTGFARLVASPDLINTIAAAPAGTSVAIRRIDVVDMRDKRMAAGGGN
jgi:hypothetical protein